MSVSAARFELALKELKSSDWERFERLCSVFLAAEFNGVRTMASPGGDRGRDAELYRFDGEPNILFQFSVRSDWETKIGETVKRLRTEFPSVSSIVFMSSQIIGARGDKARRLAREQGVSLDVRDRSWFVERVDADESRSRSAGELSRVMVDTLLESSGVIQKVSGLDGQDAKTALVFLELQAKDDDNSKGLTKACFESLVKASLHGTSSKNKKSRDDIKSYVFSLLPQHNETQLSSFVDAALRRMEKSSVKHFISDDEFHISHEEVEKTKNKVAELTLLQASFSSDIKDIVGLTVGADDFLLDKSEQLIRKIIETYFYRLGEEFAQSVASDKEIPLHVDMFRGIVLDNSPNGKVIGNTLWIDFLYSSSMSIVNSPSPGTTEIFRLFSTAYTLFAFLSEVPDVQRATKKLFEHGTLWFDTSVLLPLFAEQSFPDDMRPFSDLMRQLRRTGLKLRATAGVVEEIERHLNLCKHYARAQQWSGRVPYVYQRYALAGGTRSRLNGWLEQFIGDFRPIDDLADFLRDSAGIETELPRSWEDLPPTLVREVTDYWQDVQDRRRGSDGVGAQAYRLAVHDTENYLSVLSERRIEPGKSAIIYLFGPKRCAI